MFKGLKALKLEVHLIMMVGGANPLNPKDEDAVVGMLNSGLEVAKKYKVKHVSSTSFEEWLAGKKLKGKAFDAAVKQVIKVHARCYKECALEKSPIEAWHLEFLRGVEFQNFHQCCQGSQGGQRDQQEDQKEILQSDDRCRPLRRFRSFHCGK